MPTTKNTGIRIGIYIFSDTIFTAMRMAKSPVKQCWILIVRGTGLGCAELLTNQFSTTPVLIFQHSMC